jgi:hypothetical protein
MRSLLTFITSIAMFLFAVEVHAQTPEVAAASAAPKAMLVYDSAAPTAGSAPDGEVRIFALADRKIIGEGYLYVTEIKLQ